MSNIDKQAVQAVADLKAGYTLGHADVAILNDLARIALASLEAEPVAYSLIFRNMDGVLNDYVNANTTFSTIEKAQAYGKGGSYVEQNDGSLQWVSDPSLDPVVVPLYTAPPAPVSVPDDVLKGLLPDAEKAEFWFEHNGKILFEGVKFNNAVFDACRDAMLQGAEPVTTAYKLPAIGWLRADYQDDNRGLRGNAPLFVLGKKDPSSVWGLDYIPLTSNSPVIPDGWRLVPEEPTHEMLEAGDEQFGTYDVYRRMIAASPQQK